MTHPFAVDSDTLSGMKPLTKVVFSLGSNDGDRLEMLQGAMTTLRSTPDVMVADVSPVYETKAVGGPEDNPDFLNIVVVAETTLPPRTLLERAMAIEDAYDRDRQREVPNGPRTLDVDLIVVGDVVQRTDHLALPHPHAHERAFVLVPWLDVDPTAELPGQGKVADLVEGMDTSGVSRRDDLVLED